MRMLMTNHCTSTDMSSYRYHAVQLLMAQSQMRRGSHDEALSHWSELLSKAESSREKAYVYQNIAECCIQLGMENIDWIVYFLVRYHSTIHWRERCNTVLNYLLHLKEQTTLAILPVSEQVQPLNASITWTWTWVMSLFYKASSLVIRNVNLPNALIMWPIQ